MINLNNTLINDDIDYIFKRDTITCSNCSNKSLISHEYYDTEQLMFKLCEFCNILLNYKTKSLFQYAVLCNSEMDQLKIIQLTYDFYKLNKKFPTINEIDPDAIVIKKSFPIALKNIKSKYKIFYTDMINYDCLPFNSMFNKIKKLKEYEFYSTLSC